MRNREAKDERKKKNIIVKKKVQVTGNDCEGEHHNDVRQIP